LVKIFLAEDVSLGGYQIKTAPLLKFAENSRTKLLSTKLNTPMKFIKFRRRPVTNKVTGEVKLRLFAIREDSSELPVLTDLSDEELKANRDAALESIAVKQGEFNQYGIITFNPDSTTGFEEF